MEIIGYIASILIGISIGLIGAGGSILAVPILVYLFRVEPTHATSYSLFIVGVTALFGCYRQYRMGYLRFRSAVFFAMPSVSSILFVRKLVLPQIPNHIAYIAGFDLTKDILLMLVFAILMLGASRSMIRKSKPAAEHQKPNFIRLTIIGLGVGTISGFLGSGGGFLIIPALIFFARLPMKQAVGTSLLIIFLNSFIGFSGDIINGVQLDFQLLFSVTIIAIIGMLLGVWLSKKVSGEQLKPAFGWFILIMGVFIIIQELFLK